MLKLKIKHDINQQNLKIIDLHLYDLGKSE